ncbi:hypothetical protein [Moritella sp. 28]|nr:hypothetical protein [Moritella sp. 28]
MANSLFLLASIFLLLTLGKVIKKTIVTDENAHTELVNTPIIRA